MTTRFVRFQLRTTDVDAARTFYARTLDLDDLEIVALPPEVAARGAPPHWLGHVGVDDVERAAEALVAHGAIRLGPTQKDERGPVALVRDAGGAVLALGSITTASRSPIVWHVLDSLELERTWAGYAAAFGWTVTGELDLGPVGIFQTFAWRAGQAPVGAMTDLRRRADDAIHPQWLFHFGIADLDRAVAAVRESGGVVIGPIVLPSGGRVAVCDDPQGAAFALLEGPAG